MADPAEASAATAVPLCSRRTVVQGLAAGVSAAMVGALAKPAQAALSEEDISADLQQRLRACRPAGDPLEALLAGNGRFAALWQQAARAGDDQERRRLLAGLGAHPCALDPAALARGQQPWAAVLTCSDSRLSPELLFDVGPGTLFEVRTAGNTASAVGLASLEYAVAALEVGLIVVLGHAGCGAVQAALAATAPPTPGLEELLGEIRPHLRPGDPITVAVRRQARAVAAQLPARSALLASHQAAGTLRIVPLHCELADGVVSRL